MLNWLTRRFGQREGLTTQAQHIQAVAAHNAYLWPNLDEIATQSAIYQASPWVYVAVNRIAEAAALTPLIVYGLMGEQRLTVERHPLEDLLNHPNPAMSRFELLEQTIGMLELTGNAYWYLVGDADGTPVQIWPLRPERVRVVPDSTGYDFVKGYLYEVEGQQIPLEAVEVVHFKRWHPANDFYGLSALQAARYAITTDKAMAEWNRNTFGKDNAVPAGIVNITDYVSDSDFERIKREWRASYGGPQRKTAFLRGGSIQWHDIGLNHTELDFLKGRTANRDEILNIFGVPVGLVSDNATEANAKVAERVFIERTLWPKLVRIAQKITQQLLPFWPGDAIAEFKDIRPTDVQDRLDEIRTAQAVLSINEIREQYYRLPPVPWGTLPVGVTSSVDEAPTDDPANASLESEAEAPPDGNTPQAVDIDAALTELNQWERFILKRWGNPNRRQFEPHILPDDLAFEVNVGLLVADSPDEVRLVFAIAQAVLQDGLLDGEDAGTQSTTAE